MFLRRVLNHEIMFSVTASTGLAFGGKQYPAPAQDHVVEVHGYAPRCEVRIENHAKPASFAIVLKTTFASSDAFKLIGDRDSGLSSGGSRRIGRIICLGFGVRLRVRFAGSFSAISPSVLTEFLRCCLVRRSIVAAR